jgi:hypothetical protein
VSVLLAGMVALLGLNTATAANEVSQRKYDSANAALNDKIQQLTRDLAQRQSPEQLAKAAAALGLIPAANPAFLRFNPDGSVTILGTAIVIPAPAKPKSSSKSSSSTTPTSTPTTTPKTTPKTTPTTTPKTTPTTTPTKTTPTPSTSTLPGGPR